MIYEITMKAIKKFFSLWNLRIDFRKIRKIIVYKITLSFYQEIHKLYLLEHLPHEWPRSTQEPEYSSTVTFKKLNACEKILHKVLKICSRGIDAIRDIIISRTIVKSKKLVDIRISIQVVDELSDIFSNKTN